MNTPKVLYFSNIRVPYRVSFFNKLAQECDLTVLYEREKSSNRNETWTKSVQENYKSIVLDGVKIGRESSFSFQVSSILKQEWDSIIVGCYNDLVQIYAIITMRQHHIPYIINLDGESFIGEGLKNKIKKYVLRGADCYLTAGIEAGKNLIKALGDDIKIQPYYFSSLSDKEIKENISCTCKRDNYVLVVGQYYNYKGMDVAFKVASLDHTIKYKFVGMGERTKDFISDFGQAENVELIPFLNKQELDEEYKRCCMLLLPSRQECWGLVVNEAASFGTPVVSTYGSGAAVEFLAKDYPEYLAQPGDHISLYNSVKLCFDSDNREYSNFLKEKSQLYSIEESVKKHLNVIYKCNNV